MTLAETLLSKLGEPRPTSPGRWTVAHADAASGWSAGVTVEMADALSSRIWEITCERAGEPYALKAWANALAERITGLLEPLRIVEVDDLRGEAILRSDAPSVRNDVRSHYELKLAGGRKAVLRRFSAAANSSAKREQTPFVLTHEVLGKLIEDLTGSI